MKRVLLFFCLWVACTAVGRSQRLVAVGKGYSCTSVNTAVFRNNSLVTHGGEQYISYYDQDGHRETEVGFVRVDITSFPISGECKGCT